MRIPRLLLFLAALLALGPFSAAQSQPLTRADVIALVAGDALPEAVEHWVARRGVDFAYDESMRQMLVRVGAADTVIAAVRKAPRFAAAQPAPPPETLNYLLRAGELLRHKAYSHARKEIETALRLTPDEPALLFVLGHILRGEDDLLSSGLVYKKLLELAPGYPQAHTKLAYALYRMEDGRGAVRAADAALAHWPQDAEALKNRGLGLDAQGEHAAAIAEYRKALRIKPEYPAVLYNIGLAYYNQRKYTDAGAAYRAAVALDPKNDAFQNNLGLALAKVNDFSGAIEAFRAAIRLKPDDLYYQISLIDVLRRGGHADAAVKEAAELVARAPRFARARLNYAWALMDRQRFDQAMEQYREASKLSPNDAEVYHGMGLLFEKMGRRRDAHDVYQRAVELAPTAEHYQLLGTNLYYLKDFAKARQALAQSIQLDRRLGLAQYWMGMTLVELQEFPLAVSHLRTALPLLPNRPWAISALAWALEKSNDLGAAREQYRLATIAEPSMPNLENYRRLAFLTRAPLEEVIATYKVAIAASAAQGRSPELTTRHAQLAGFFAAAGRPADAAAEYERAVQNIEANPDHPQPFIDSIFTGYLAILNGQKQPEQAAAVAARQERLRARAAITDTALRARLEQTVQLAWREPAKAEDALLALLQDSGELPRTSEVPLDVLNHLIGFYGNQGKHELAFKYASQAAEVAGQRFGAGSERELQQLSRVADSHVSAGRPAEAEKVRRRILEAWEGEYGAVHPRLVHVLTSLANDQLTQKHFEEAEATLLRAQRISGTGDDGDFAVAERLASLYRQWGRVEQAEAAYRRSIAQAEKKFGADHPVILGSLASLAMTLRAQGKSAEAEEIEARRQRIETARKK